MDQLQRPGKVLRQVEVGDGALAFGANVSYLFAAPLSGLLGLNDLGLERRLLIAVVIKPFPHLCIAGGDVHRGRHFSFDWPGSLITLRPRRVERTAEAQFIRVVESWKRAVAAK